MPRGKVQCDACNNSNQHPDHHVLAGEAFIDSVYNAIRNTPNLWKSTLLLITYDEHVHCGARHDWAGCSRGHH